MLRHPRTTQERRTTIGFLREARAFGIKIRRVSPKQLPSVYDDIPVTTNDRSWKRFRRTQYKLPT